jgi:hypothetical protein
VRPGEVGKALIAASKMIKSAGRVAIFAASGKAVRRLRADKTASDTMQLRKSWHVQPHAGLVEDSSGDVLLVAEVVGDAPHTGIIERGARPHSVSAEGRARIREWVIRKGLVSLMKPKSLRRGAFGPRQMVAKRLTRGEAESEFAYLVDEVVWGIVHKIEREGAKPHYIVQRRLVQFTKDLRLEHQREIKARMASLPK